MRRVQLKTAVYHPERGNFDFVKVKEDDYLDRGEYVEIKSAVSEIKYAIPKSNIAYVSDE